MTVSTISTSNVNAIKGTNLEGMSIQIIASMVMLEVGATKKKEAELKRKFHIDSYLWFTMLIQIV